MVPFKLFGRQPRGKHVDAGETGDAPQADMDEAVGGRNAERAPHDGPPQASAPLGKHSPGYVAAIAEDADDEIDRAVWDLEDDVESSPPAPAPTDESLSDDGAEEPPAPNADDLQADDGEENTSAWMVLDSSEDRLCPNCGASVGFARRCPQCGSPMFADAIPVDAGADAAEPVSAAGETVFAGVAGTDAEPGEESDEGAEASVASSRDAGPVDEFDPSAASPARETVAAAGTDAPSNAAIDTEQVEAEHDRLVEAAREIRALAAEEQVAAVQSRLLRDKRLMNEISRIMSEEKASKPGEGDAPAAQAEPPKAPSEAGRAATPIPPLQVDPSSVRQIRPGTIQPPQRPEASAPAAPAPQSNPVHPNGAGPMADPIPFGGNALSTQQPGAPRAMRIMSGEKARAGVYADIANAITLNGRTVIDFLMIDRTDVEPGVDEAVHQARIIMQPDAVVALRDMLTDHIERFYTRHGE